MSGKQPLPRQISRQVLLAGMAVVVTAGALGLAQRARWMALDPAPLSFPELPRLIFDPYPLGVIFQATVVPAVLIYLLSTTSLLRRVIIGQERLGDRRKLFAALLLIQFLVLGYDLGRSFFVREPPTAILGLLVVVTAALLGGWRLSLALALVVTALHGTQLLIDHVGPAVALALRTGYESAGLRGALTRPDWTRLFLAFYVYNLWASAALWAGAMAGLGAALLGRRRFSPLAALLLGAGIDLGAGTLTALAGIPPGTWMLVPSALVSGVTLSAVALMFRNVQADAARRRVEAAELAHTRAELRTLRAQINPHFLFNALTTIRYFVRTDPETARRLLIDLSEVFQRALRSGDVVPLRDELEYVEAYLSLEKARLGDRLQVEWVIPMQDGWECPVPTLILQPIVENAVIHGIAQKPEGGVLCVAIDKSETMLLLQVQDNGAGISAERLAETLSPEVKDQQSIGLRNVDRRLRALYGEEHCLVVRSEPGEGTLVQIKIPIAT
jgi:signal transduction histidine kinase